MASLVPYKRQLYWLGFHNMARKNEFKSINGFTPVYYNWKSEETNFEENRAIAFASNVGNRYEKSYWRSFKVEKKLNFMCTYIIKSISDCSISSYCHSNARCINTSEGYICACKPGFSGDGKSCFDIDECIFKTHKCDSNARCFNNIGSYDCLCNDGYETNGEFCEKRKGKILSFKLFM